MREARPGIVARAVQALRYTISGVGPGTWMGPLQPLAPMAPPETAGRQFDYPVGYNLCFVPRSTEPVGFVKLRLLADRCDLLRLVIERQKDLLESLDWSVKPREIRPGERPAEGAFQDRIAEIRRFFDCPDGVHDWAQWLRMVLEDLAVIDAVSLYRRRDRLGRLAALEPLDGATIKVLLDASGRRPMAPDPAYQQILKGIPAVDYSADELLYYPRNPRTNHAYGYSPVEQIIRLAETAIERLGSQRAYFTHGNVSDGIFTGPAGWQTDQIKAWQGYWDALFAGNVEQRRAGWWVPAGTQYQALKQPALKDEFDEWLARLICFAFSTSPTPFVKAQNRATAETQQQTAEEGGLAPIMAYVKRLVDRVIATDLGCPDLEFVWSADREFDPLTAARIDDLALRNGSRTVNEVRDRLGLDTLPGGDQPMVLTPTRYVPLTPQPLGKGYFIEDQHPRQPLGSPGGIGGQFAPKDGGVADTAPVLLAQAVETETTRDPFTGVEDKALEEENRRNDPLDRTDKVEGVMDGLDYRSVDHETPEGNAELDDAFRRDLRPSRELEEKENPTAEQGYIYWVEREKTKSGNGYVGRTEDKEQREKESRDGRDRRGADIVGTYPKGDVRAGRIAEQKAINEQGGVKNLDNRRNEIAPHKWERYGIAPPSENVGE